MCLGQRGVPWTQTLILWIWWNLKTMTTAITGMCFTLTRSNTSLFWKKGTFCPKWWRGRMPINFYIAILVLRRQRVTNIWGPVGKLQRYMCLCWWISWNPSLTMTRKRCWVHKISKVCFGGASLFARAQDALLWIGSATGVVAETFMSLS